MPSVGTPAFHDCEGSVIEIDENQVGSKCEPYAVIKLKNMHGDAMMFFDNILSIKLFHCALGQELERRKSA